MTTHHTWKVQLHTNQKQISHHNQENTPTVTTLQNGNKSETNQPPELGNHVTIETTITIEPNTIMESQ